MNPMKRITLILAAALLGMAACEKTILPEDASYDQRNVVLKHFLYFDGVTMDTNKRFMLGNAEVRFQDIEIVFGEYYFTDHLDDTLTPNFKDTVNPYVFDPVAASLAYNTDARLYRLPKGVYSGAHHFRMGLDSTANATPPSALREGHSLRHPGVHRGEGNGYNILYIKGLYRDAMDTTILTPDKPFVYRVSNELMSLDWFKSMSFNVVPNRDVNINIVWDIDKLLLGVDPLLVDDLDVDPSDPIAAGLYPTIKGNMEASYSIQL